MNSLTIIGNVTKEPEARQTPNGISVTSFTVAVNNKYKPDEEAQFFRVTTWRKLAENCAKFVTKGSKVAVHGSVKKSDYTRNDGTTGSSLEVDATDVEFLSSRGGADAPAEAVAPAPEPQYTDVTNRLDDLPF